jgi:hypothetical protein
MLKEKETKNEEKSKHTNLLGTNLLIVQPVGC